MQAALGRIGAAPIAERSAIPAHHQDQGPADRARTSSANIIVRANPDGSVVRVKDVARVDLGAKTQDRYSRFNGAPAAAIGIYQSPGANAVDVARQVRDTMADLATRFPPISPTTCSSMPRSSSPRRSTRSSARWSIAFVLVASWSSCFSASCGRR